MMKLRLGVLADSGRAVTPASKPFHFDRSFGRLELVVWRAGPVEERVRADSVLAHHALVNAIALQVDTLTAGLAIADLQMLLLLVDLVILDRGSFNASFADFDLSALDQVLALLVDVTEWLARITVSV